MKTGNVRIIRESGDGRVLSRRIESAAMSLVGLARKENEDYCAIDTCSGAHAVADGIGGGLHGEVYSRVAVKAFIEAYAAGNTAEEAMLKAATRVYEQKKALEWSDEVNAFVSGTTLLSCVVGERSAEIFSAGDSSAFLLRDKELTKLTPNQPLTYETRWNALGFSRIPHTFHLGLEIESGDVLLLATDGITAGLGEEALAQILGSYATAAEIANALCDRAQEAGSVDDVSACVIRVKE